MINYFTQMFFWKATTITTATKPKNEKKKKNANESVLKN